jgi:hypothetical protein
MIFRLLGGDPKWQAGQEYRHLSRLDRAEAEGQAEVSTEADDE